MRYSSSHEWVRVEGNLATVGISSYAQSQIGEIVYVELPAVGRHLSCGDGAVVLESTKAAADVYTPLSGKVVAINQNLDMDRLNTAPETEGWLFQLEMMDPAELDDLMDHATYCLKCR